MAHCKECEGLIVFQRIGSKWRVVNADGSDHFDICAERQARMMRVHGKPFEDETGKGYLWRGRKCYTEQVGPWIRGDLYQPGCDCDVPPWEPCAHSMEPEQVAHLNEIVQQREE